MTRITMLSSFNWSYALSASCNVIPAPTTVSWSFSDCRTTLLPPTANFSSGLQSVGNFSRVVRMYTIPPCSAISATSCAVWLGSLGYNTVLPKIDRIIDRSSSAICEGPSSPIETPACEPTRRIFAREIAAIRMKSYAREKNAAKVEANGILWRTLIPTVEATNCCSAIYCSKQRSGNAFANSSAQVELLTSPSSATTSGFASPRALRASPYALRVATPLSCPYFGNSTAFFAASCGNCPAAGFCTGKVMLRA